MAVRRPILILLQKPSALYSRPTWEQSRGMSQMCGVRDCTASIQRCSNPGACYSLCSSFETRVCSGYVSILEYRHLSIYLCCDIKKARTKKYNTCTECNYLALPFHGINILSLCVCVYEDLPSQWVYSTVLAWPSRMVASSQMPFPL